MLTVLTGGARSGKSSLAVRRAASTGQPVVFVATCPQIEGDNDLAERIANHRQERPEHWSTVEAEVELAAELGRLDSDTTVVIDCLTLWINNLMMADFSDTEVDQASTDALAIAAARPGQTIVVTNEVGLGIVPADALSRRYRDLLGRVNQAWIGAANNALFMVAGQAIPLSDPDRLLP